MMADITDRESLQRIIVAIESGRPIAEGDRSYAVKALRTMNQLAFYGYDVMRVYRQRQQESNTKTHDAVRELQILQKAIDKGAGLAVAWALIHAQRESKDTGHPPLTEAIDYLRAIDGMSQAAAIRECADVFGRAVDSVARHYKRAKARRRSRGGDTAN